MAMVWGINKNKSPKGTSVCAKQVLLSVILIHYPLCQIDHSTFHTDFLRDGPLFSPGGGGGGYRDFQEAGKFFLTSIEHLQIFSSTHCADNFF